jgi:hypothetical protein
MAHRLLPSSVEAIAVLEPIGRDLLDLQSSLIGINWVQPDSLCTLVQVILTRHPIRSQSDIRDGRRASLDFAMKTASQK